MPEVPAYLVINTNGEPDPSFNNGHGLATLTKLGDGDLSAEDFTWDRSSGELVSAGGKAVLLTQLSSTGSIASMRLLDPFLPDLNSQNPPVARQVSLGSKGTYVAADAEFKTSSNRERSALIMRVNSSGSFDSDFGEEGVIDVRVLACLPNDTPLRTVALLVFPNEKILFVGALAEDSKWSKLLLVELNSNGKLDGANLIVCLLYTSPSPRDLSTSRMPSSA